MPKISYSDALQGKPKDMFQIMDEIRELIRCSIERIIQGYIVRHQEADASLERLRRWKNEGVTTSNGLLRGIARKMY